MNPLRQTALSLPIPPDLPVVAIVTHLPDDGGYHRGRRDLVLDSIYQATTKAGCAHWLVVWDNGSYYGLRDELSEHDNIDALILSRNIGISNAMRRLLWMYSDSIVSIANDDVFYEQGWLVKQIEILKAYPNVGTVSGVTTRFHMGKAVMSTERWVKEQNIKVQPMEVPREWDEQHGLSIGKSRNAHLQEMGHIRAPLIEYNGVKAIIGGNHVQFTCYANRIAPLLAHSNKYMERLFPFDVLVDAMGYLRLLTPERTARHVGNVLTESEQV